MPGHITMVVVDLDKAVDTVPRRLAIAPCNSNITLNHIIQGRRKLNQNITADTAGLKAENLNIAPVLTDTLLHNLFLGINSTGHMPEDMCIGAITSIPRNTKTTHFRLTTDV